MSPADDTFERIDALIGIGLRLARTAPSGRLLLARIADAIDTAWLPGRWGDAIAAELTAAQAAATRDPIDRKQVEAVLRHAWDAKPSDELDSLELAPAAVTATAQVHRGERGGEPVAVKLMRPGLVAGVRQDLALLEGLMSPLGAAFPALDPGALMREFRQRVLDDLDLEQEAANQRRFHRALRAHDTFVIPKPHTDLARDSVCVSEWIDGKPLAMASGDVADRACVQLLRFVIGGMRAGVVHADPDPHDVLLLDDGRIAILDFGAIAEPDSGRVDATAVAIEAFVAQDAAGMAGALSQLGWLPPELVSDAMALVTVVLGDFTGSDPVRLDSDAVIAVRERLDAHPERVAPLLINSSLHPADLWPARAVAQLFTTIARIGAAAPWRDELRAALRDGWNAA